MLELGRGRGKETGVSSQGKSLPITFDTEPVKNSKLKSDLSLCFKEIFVKVRK